MYHFVADPHTPELRLSTTEQVSSSTTQYLKSFQLEAVKKLYDHLNKYEFCILNDENGLGKSATIVALLSAIANHKKTLIILQNDDHQLAGWEFHFNVLAERLKVCVIQNSENTTDSDHNIYLAKWGVLRSIGDMSKLNFDYVIVDHRGFALNNTFCTSMLLKHFEKRVNIVISSLDITSDLKLLHNILHLGGRLEQKFLSFKTFEKKFRLPEAKEVFSKKVDLEEYFKQREILGEMVKDYRLRRYCHQFDQYMPLVTPQQYKTNLTIWASTHNSHITLSGDSTATTTNDVNSTAGTEEIIECLVRIKHERQEADSREPLRECTEILESSDEPIIMSPLFFDPSESGDVPDEVIFLQSSEEDQNKPNPNLKTKTILPMINDDVVLVSFQELKGMATPVKQTNKNDRLTQSEPKRKKNNRIAQLKTIVNVSKSNEDEVICTPPKRVTRRMTQVTAASSPETRKNLIVKSENSPISSKTRSPKEIRNRTLDIAPKGVHNRKTRSMQRLTRSAEANRSHSKYMATNLALIIDKKSPSVRNTRTTKKCKEDVITSSSKASKKSPNSATVPSSPSKQTKSPPNSKDKAMCDKPTRSKVGNKQKNSKTKAKCDTTRETSKVGNNSTKKENMKSIAAKDKNQAVADSPQVPLLLSASSISEYEDIQCGQKLPSDLSLENNDEEVRFRMPSIPLSTTQSNLLPMTTSFLNNSDVGFMPAPNQNTEIIVLSSQDECSISSSTTTQSRRTRAFKSRKNGETVKPKEKPLEICFEKPSTSFGELLARHRCRNKSPDLFSNCSDVMAVIPAQQQQQPSENSSIFEGFKIFGSEVKQFQQQHAKAKQHQKEQYSSSHSNHREKNGAHSCLNILEKTELSPPQRQKTKETRNNNVKSIVLPSLPHTSQQRNTQSVCVVLNDDDDDFFEITNNREFGGTLRVNSRGDVSPVHHQQHTQATSTKATQNNKITNYLIGSGNSGNTPAEELTVVEQLLETPTNKSTMPSTHRKSPKSLKATQSTKLTRWFGSAPAERKIESANGDNAFSENVRLTRQNAGPTKRKRLDLFQ